MKAQSRNTQIVLAAYDALGAQNREQLAALIDPQITIWQTEALPWGGSFHGPDGTEEFMHRMLTHLRPSVAVEESFEAGEQVVVIGRTKGNTRMGNSEFDVRIVHVWTVRNQRIARFEPYVDTPEMLAALNRKTDPGQ